MTGARDWAKVEGGEAFLAVCERVCGFDPSNHRKAIYNGRGRVIASWCSS